MYKEKQTESRLLIYQKQEDLIQYVYQLLKKYPKIEKYALVSEIRTSMFRTLEYIILANKINNKMNKLKIINQIDAEIAIQKFFSRFSYKNKYISHNNYYEWSKRLDEIGKIIGGWIKSCLKE